ncbi:Uncharacterised protein [Xylophilus ampelinus]|nr:hypothetical protein [Variovorax sp.]VTY31510.1 Uncharacterised protein [Xylophilus ampelinus]|tara:strand:+ start:71 stop:388 length:318 start_codon:yes stop_codon:yes gene_type:complete
MFLRWNGSRVVLEDPDDFKSFKIVVSGKPPVSGILRTALADVGEFESDSVFWVSATALRRWSGRTDEPGWHTQLDAMIAKAASHGWIDPSTGAIRAHVEYEGTQQ